MSVTIDANVLLYASDESSPRRAVAVDLLGRLAAGPEILYMFWPVVVAYLRIATHPGIFERPLPIDVAHQNAHGLLARPHVRTLGEQPGFWQVFGSCIDVSGARGNLVSDAHLVGGGRPAAVTDPQRIAGILESALKAAVREDAPRSPRVAAPCPGRRKAGRTPWDDDEILRGQCSQKGRMVRS